MDRTPKSLRKSKTPSKSGSRLKERSSAFKVTREAEESQCRDEGRPSVRMVHKSIRVPLMPASIGQEEWFIEDMIRTRWQGKYVEELKGILLKYENMKFDNNLGEIRDDLPYIFWQISADFYMFQPMAGAIVRGKIIRLGATNIINCILNNCMSASVIKPDPIPDQLDPYIKLEHEIYFKIDKVDFDHCFVHGIITPECVRMTCASIDRPEEVMDDGAPTNLDDF